MSSLALLVLLLLALVVPLVLGVLGYLVHRHPTLGMPLTVVLAGAAILATVIVPIALR
ncbi:hypothetical protein ACFXJ6_40195 [Streptomyces sp. NPDC059218]|uniref:hypothetical protein n=1 Tax=unclassified Streptomyces TaxID=2593676 RepID=UPI0036A6A4D2